MGFNSGFKGLTFPCTPPPQIRSLSFTEHHSGTTVAPLQTRGVTGWRPPNAAASSSETKIAFVFASTKQLLNYDAVSTSRHTASNFWTTYDVGAGRVT